MDNNVIETGAVEKIAVRSEKDALIQLNDLELAFVGGGIAELVGV